MNLYHIAFRIFRVLSVVVVFCLFSCSGKEDGKGSYDNWYLDSYITGYLCNLNNIEIMASHYSPIVDAEKHILSLPSGKEEVSTAVNFTISFQQHRPLLTNWYNEGITSLEDVARYREKVKIMGDTGFKGYDAMYSRHYAFNGNGSGGFAIDGAISSVSVVCDRDIDAAHPASTPLDDVLTIFYEDLFWVVQHKYATYNEDDAYFIQDNEASRFPYALRGQKLQEFNKTVHPYISTVFVLYADQLVFDEHDYSFTVSITLNDGTKVEQQARLQ